MSVGGAMAMELYRAAFGSVGFTFDFKAPLKGWYKTENGVLVIDGDGARRIVPVARNRCDRAFSRFFLR